MDDDPILPPKNILYESQKDFMYSDIDISRPLKETLLEYFTDGVSDAASNQELLIRDGKLYLVVDFDYHYYGTSSLKLMTPDDYLRESDIEKVVFHLKDGRKIEAEMPTPDEKIVKLQKETSDA